MDICSLIRMCRLGFAYDREMGTVQDITEDREAFIMNAHALDGEIVHITDVSDGTLERYLENAEVDDAAFEMMLDTSDGEEAYIVEGDSLSVFYV